LLSSVAFASLGSRGSGAPAIVADLSKVLAQSTGSARWAPVGDQ
jgi:hypothetical protein